LALRAFALAGRFPWLAFFSFFADLAISIFLFALNRRCFYWNPFSAAPDHSLTGISIVARSQLDGKPVAVTI
jgi:hypothetical protein